MALTSESCVVKIDHALPAQVPLKPLLLSKDQIQLISAILTALLIPYSPIYDTAVTGKTNTL